MVCGDDNYCDICMGFVGSARCCIAIRGVLKWIVDLPTMRLSDLKSGESAVILKVLGHGAFRKRVMEMGFVKGRVITSILSAPLKDPVKYRLMGYEVSLRRSEASMIEILPLEENLEPAGLMPVRN